MGFITVLLWLVATGNKFVFMLADHKDWARGMPHHVLARAAEQYVFQPRVSMCLS
jgi:hypothetical protein